jgi:hypothetical protein
VDVFWDVRHLVNLAHFNNFVVGHRRPPRPFDRFFARACSDNAACLSVVSVEVRSC